MILTAILLSLSSKPARAALDVRSAENLASHFKTKLNEGELKSDAKQLVIQLKWESDRVNAHATRDDQGNMLVTVDGGMLRHQLMTEETFMAVLCHELGHHLGGAPRQFRGNTQFRGWSSAEGQADFYAASKCLPALWSNQNVEKSGPEWDKALELCKGDRVCARVGLAGFALAQLFASERPDSGHLELGHQTQFPVFTTVYGHSTPQCRAETFLAGARCADDKDTPFDPQNPFQGDCSEAGGGRPACWFAPEEFR